MKTIYSLALVAAAAVGFAACGPVKRSDSGKDSASGSRDMAAPEYPSTKETDERIESSFKQAYIYRTYLKDDSIRIESTDGRVSLSGDVTNADHSSLAEHTAGALPGVRSVDNRIQVTGAKVAENSDEWIRSKVRTELLFHRNVSAGRTSVEVLNGTVTLRGEASSEAQRELTAEYARDVQGVVDVKNEMTVAPAPASGEQTVAERVDDASITAQVKMSLLFHRSTSPLKTKVETTDGVVTVSGEAKNGAERDLVTKLVTDINGVTSVVNNMTIDATVSSN